jgi:uncharacterized protein YbjT (DUF2867 family)
MSKAPVRTALLVGASGLVGKQVLQQLLANDHYGKVTVLVRKPLAIKHARLSEQVIDFESLAQQRLPKVDDAFCCLGTTIKVAGSKDAFRRVDYDYVLAFAASARQAGAAQFLLVSAMGANSKSGVFYSRVKGEIEAAISKLGYTSVSIFRPSMLTGDRGEHRLGERLILAFSRPISALIPARYRPISDVAVATAMLDTALRVRAGNEMIESDRLQKYQTR